MSHPRGLANNLVQQGFSVTALDYDNDGWPDLLLADGHVYPEVDSAQLGSAYRQSRLLYRNSGKSGEAPVKFIDITSFSGPGINDPRSSRGLAVADFFNDGRMEAVVNNLSDRPMLLVNVAQNANHWLALHLTGTTSNRDAIGARIELRTAKRLFVDEVRSGSSYNSSSDLRVHFGLGSETQIQSVHVRWPNGVFEDFAPPAKVDRFIDIAEGKGLALSHAKTK